MKKYVLGQGAELDLDEIWEYIAQDNIDAADRWIGRFYLPGSVAIFGGIFRNSAGASARGTVRDMRIAPLK